MDINPEHSPMLSLKGGLLGCFTTAFQPYEKQNQLIKMNINLEHPLMLNLSLNVNDVLIHIIYLELF